MEIDKVKVCKPIEALVEVLQNSGFEIVESKISDYHFHEVFIKLKGKNTDVIRNISIQKIKNIDDKTFACDCHWSVVKLDT